MRELLSFIERSVRIPGGLGAPIRPAGSRCGHGRFRPGAGPALVLFVVAAALLAAAGQGLQLGWMGLGPALAAPPAGGLDELPFEAPGDAADAVTAELVAESRTIVPGQTLQLGVHLEMKPGWHTYWQNGGDAGLPTTIQWDLPEGFVAGPIEWPVPHRYVESGDIVTYGYADEVTLLVAMNVPADVEVGEAITLKAQVEWLQCKSLCVPGEATVSLRLPVARHSELDPAAAPLFAAAREHLPRPVSDYEGLHLDSFLSLNAVPPGQGAHVAFIIEGLSLSGKATLTWFPELHPPVSVGEALIDRTNGTLRVVAPLEVGAEAEAASEATMAAVLKIVDGSRHWYLRLTEVVPIARPDQQLRAQHEELFGAILEGAAVSGGGSGAPGAGGEGGGTAGPGVSGGGAGGTGAANAFAPTGSVWRYLLLALIGGVILNIMPCVLPVLSLKVMGFVSHADRDRATVFKLGLMFAAGVLASFLTLALVVVVLQRAGALLGWGFQFQNPTFVVVMIAIIFGFGLNLFGLFEIVPPVGRLGQGVTNHYTEQFFNGVLATILATPCSAPFLGTALGFAFTQPAWVILAIFLTIGAGLALPYVLLSINPAWLRFVPKPGPWMERFKQFMGFLLMATAVWLLWVLGQQLGGDGVIQVLWFVLVLSLVLWIHGAFLDLSASRRRRIVVWTVGVLLLVGGWKYFLAGTLSSEGLARAATQRGTVATQHEGGREWVTFTPQKLEATVRAGKTVFLDFTAAWCLTCKANEKAVIDSGEVQSKFDELGVVTMVGDWTQRDPQISRMLRRYGRSGVPFYAVFPAGRPDDPIVLPEVINRSMVVEALEKAGPSR